MIKEHKKSFKFSVVLLTLLAIFFTALLINYLSFLKKNLMNDEITYIRELVIQSAADIQDKMLSEQTVVKYAGKLLEINNHNKTMLYLKELAQSQDFNVMGYVTADGKAYDTLDQSYDYVHEPFFTESILGSDYLSEPFSITSDNNSNNTIAIRYSSPITDINGNITGVVYAVSNIEFYTSVLNYSIINNKGYVCLINRYGTVLASSNSQIHEHTDITEIAPDDISSMQIIKNNIYAQTAGMNSFSDSDGKHYMFYAPSNECAVALSVSEKTITDKYKFIMMYTLCVCVCLFILFLLLIVFIIRSNKISRVNLEKLAYLDVVTKGRNYNKFRLDAEKLLQRKNIPYAVITLDINRFKYINDLYGYDEGTRILKSIYDTVNSMIESNELVGRMGNDKFVFLFTYKDRALLQERIDSLCFEISNNSYHNFVFAVGIYEITERGLSIDTMIDRAMIALKSIKNGYQTAYAFYDEKIRNNILRERSMENDMQTSLDNGEFVIYYQPKYYINNSTLAGAEALVRWIHHKYGFMPPDEFIPLFEKSNFIVKLDHYVFEQNCKNMRGWINEGKSLVTISINFSRVHLNNPDCLDEYERIIKKYKIPPEYIEFEFTESAIFENTTLLVKILEHIHSMGCSVSMDDFGTGYSSLNMLKEVPVDVLKLDKEFFSDSADSSRGKDIIESIVALAKKLNIHVVAEGVEEQEQLEFLHTIKCDVAQGYFFSKPIPTDEFEKLLDNYTKKLDKAQ